MQAMFSILNFLILKFLIRKEAFKKNPKYYQSSKGGVIYWTL